MAATVDTIWSCMMVLGGMGFIFSIAYPLAALICFPFYRRFFNNTISLKEYMRGL